MAKISLVIITYIIVCVGQLHAQIADFSQAFSNYVNLNPAFVGIQGEPNVFTSFRTKNASMGGYTTAYTSFDMSLAAPFGGVGCSFLHDMQDGVFSQTQIMAIYSHSFKINKHLLARASLAAGYVHNATNFTSLVFPDMLNVFQEQTSASGEELEKIARNNFNSEMGVLLYNQTFSAGVSVKNLQGNVTEYNKNANLLPRIYTFHAMAKFSTTKAFTQQYRIWFYPHVGVVLSGVSSYSQMGVVLQKWWAQFGGAYRQNYPTGANSFIIFVGVVEKRFKFAYNCELTIKSPRRFDTHEVSLSYQFEGREKKKKIEAVKAPLF